jgi:hypothetical protein
MAVESRDGGRNVALQPQDVVVALKVAVHPEEKWTFVRLGQLLALSPSKVHAAAQRATRSRLLIRVEGGRRTVHVGNLIEFSIHGVKYAFPAGRAGLTRGYPTSSAARVLEPWFGEPGPTPPVWPHAEGEVWGEGIAPLYPRAVEAALKDERLYSALALLDVFRIGGARERGVAETVLRELLAGGTAP